MCQRHAKNTREQHYRGIQTNLILHSLHRASGSRAYHSDCKHTKTRTSSQIQSSQLKLGSCNKLLHLSYGWTFYAAATAGCTILQVLSHLLQSSQTMKAGCQFHFYDSSLKKWLRKKKKKKKVSIYSKKFPAEYSTQTRFWKIFVLVYSQHYFLALIPYQPRSRLTDCDYLFAVQRKCWKCLPNDLGNESGSNFTLEEYHRRITAVRKRKTTYTSRLDQRMKAVINTQHQFALRLSKP